jgi:predicted RNA-binding protein YlxR (DUF448 family)
MQKLNKRTSFYSHKTCPKEELVRFVLLEKKLTLDRTGKAQGRGAYLRKDEVEECLQKHAFARAFHQPVSALEEEAIKKAYEK